MEMENKYPGCKNTLRIENFISERESHILNVISVGRS